MDMVNSDGIEVKADMREAGFDAGFDTAQADSAAAIAGLRDEVAGLRTRIEATRVAADRVPLDGIKTADPQVQAFVDRYLRRGLDAGLELKSVTGATGAEGGFAVPREIDQMIAATLRTISPIRAIANVVQTGTAGYRKLVAVGGTPSGWVSEVAARPITNTPTFSEIAPPTGHLYANPAATQAMLDDVGFDLESWLADEVAREFARAEGQAFIAGTGVNQPKGFVTYTTTAESDAVRAFGSLQYIASGAAGGFAATNPQDKLIDLVHALKAPYRQGASFVMNSDALARVRKMKTSDGAFIWQPGLHAAAPATLLGFPVIEAEDMPVIAADSLSIAFGNFKAGYVIADRGETGVLRDPYSNKPFVHFYSTKRVGGAVVNSEAIKLMKFAVS
jgi:HK97 family phage major capsid protein